MSIEICRFLCDLLLSAFGEGKFSPRRVFCECFRIGLGLAIVGIEVGISLAGILCIVMGWAFDHAGLTISTKPRII